MAGPQIKFEHLEVADAAHNLAGPVSIVMQGVDVLNHPVMIIQAIGGLTKLEHVAAMIFSQRISAATVGESISAYAEDAVNMAEALLAECAKRQAPKAEKPVFEGVGQ